MFGATRGGGMEYVELPARLGLDDLVQGLWGSGRRPPTGTSGSSRPRRCTSWSTAATR